jgi:hypothetical protein
MSEKRASLFGSDEQKKFTRFVTITFTHSTSMPKSKVKPLVIQDSSSS